MNKYMLSFADITKYETELHDLKQHVYTNPFTGLPNNTAIIKKIVMLKKPKMLLEVVLLSVKNFEQSRQTHRNISRQPA